VVDFVVQPGSSSSPHERLALCSHGHRFCLTKSKTPISIILFGRSLDHTCKAASGSDDSADRPADRSMNSSPVQQSRTDNDQDQSPRLRFCLSCAILGHTQSTSGSRMHRLLCTFASWVSSLSCSKTQRSLVFMWPIESSESEDVLHRVLVWLFNSCRLIAKKLKIEEVVGGSNTVLPRMCIWANST
jgi:hypothetical protein